MSHTDDHSCAPSGRRSGGVRRLALRAGALAAALSLTAVAPASADVLRTLDFQSPGLLNHKGKPQQWDGYVPGRAGTSGITLGSPGSLPPGIGQAARFQPERQFGRPRSMAKLTKNATGDAGVSLSGPLDAAEGLDRWYSWWTYFPEDFDIPYMRPHNAPTILQAWHNDSSSSGCNPNEQLHVKRRPDAMRLLLKVQGGRHTRDVRSVRVAGRQGSKLTLDADANAGWTAEGMNAGYCASETNRELDLGTVEPGRWTQIVMHVRWSSDPNQGVTEVWRDGVLTSSATGYANGGANLYRDAGGTSERAFMEHGIYMPLEPRARHRSVWHAGMRIATAPEDVMAPVAAG